MAAGVAAGGPVTNPAFRTGCVGPTLALVGATIGSAIPGGTESDAAGVEAGEETGRRGWKGEDGGEGGGHGAANGGSCNCSCACRGRSGWALAVVEAGMEASAARACSSGARVSRVLVLEGGAGACC